MDDVLRRVAVSLIDVLETAPESEEIPGGMKARTAPSPNRELQFGLRPAPGLGALLSFTGQRLQGLRWPHGAEVVLAPLAFVIGE